MSSLGCPKTLARADSAERCGLRAPRWVAGREEGEDVEAIRGDKIRNVLLTGSRGPQL